LVASRQRVWLFDLDNTLHDASHAAFGKNGGDVASGRDIKGRMRGVNIGSDAHALQMRNFGGGAFFNGDMFAVGNR